MHKALEHDVLTRCLAYCIYAGKTIAAEYLLAFSQARLVDFNVVVIILGLPQVSSSFYLALLPEASRNAVQRMH